MKNCLFCNNKIELKNFKHSISGEPMKYLEKFCSKCGHYKQHRDLKIDDNLDKEDLFKILCWLREQNDMFKNIPLIDNEKLDDILNLKEKKIKEKFDLMINYLKNTTMVFEYYKEGVVEDGGHLHDELFTNFITDILVCRYIRNFNELYILFQKAIDEEFIIGEYANYNVIKFSHLAFKGIEYIESIEEVNKNLKNIFIAFNFTEELIPIFSNQVKDAVEETGFTYTIVNQETTPHDQKITDEIVAKIKSSRMIIANFTGASTNVYFEAGFAMGMKIPVIWTCKEGHNFSFDTGQFPHITWKDGDDLKQQLINRIQAII